MKNLKSIILIVATLIFTSTGCATLGDSDFVRVDPPPEAKTAEFSYEPSANETKTDISIGIVGAQYSADVRLEGLLENRASTLSNELKNAISNGVQRDLLAKGLSISGEFSSLDEMTFPQKDQSTMVLVPIINLSIIPERESTNKIYWRSSYGSGSPQELPLKVYYGEVALGGDKFEEKGEFIFRGSISLQLIEPLSRQKIWVQYVPIDELSENWTWYYWSQDIKNDQGEVIRTEKHPVQGYDGRIAAITSLYSTAYDNVMKSLSDYISREEMVQLKEDAIKLKDRWRSGN